MSYLTHSEYVNFYADGLTPEEFSVLSFQADRLADVLTTGADGVRKLAVAMPTDEVDAEIVKRGIACLIHTMWQVEQMESAAVSRGIAAGGGVSSVSSGSESISYGGSGSAIAAAAADPVAKDKLYRSTLVGFFRGVKDANGINLLYMGVY